MGVAIPLGYVEDKSSGALVVDGSLRFDRSKTNIVRTTFSSAGNRKTWTLSFWHKITDISNPYNIFTASRTSSTRPTFEVAHNYGSSGNLVLSQYNGSGYDIGVKVDGLYRDVGWYHFVVVVDTTQSTDSNRVKAYINGTQRTVTATAGGSVWPSLNTDLEIGNNVLHNISANAFGNNNPMDGYVSNFYYINGQALDASYFGYTDALTNTWRPKKYTGNLKAYTVPSGFSYWTGMNQNWNTGGSTSSGNDFINQALPSSGKVYWEVTLNSPATYRQIGIAQGASGTGTSYNDNIFGFYYNGNPPIWLTKNSSGTTRGNAVSHGSGTGTTWTSGDKLMFAWDADNDKIWFGLNGTWYASGNPATGSNPIISGEDLSANAHYFKQGRTDSENITTLTNITSGNASYFSNLDMVYDNRNTFYLPFDGNSPIGQDQSGNGNNWTPVNFGGSNTLEKATGALPILNTDGGGKVARVDVRTDSSASSLVLALPLVGIKSDFSNAVNSGTSNKAITANGNAAASSVQSNFYGGSFAFDGTGDYLTASTSSDYIFGTGDFTLECWAYFNAVNTYNALITIHNGDANWNMRVDTVSGTPRLLFYSGSTDIYSSSPTTVATGRWYHFAITRQSSSLKLWVNGVNEHTATVSNNYTINNTLHIGGQQNNLAGTYLNGYIQDLRIYKGLAKYTQNFIPASTDPDILPDTPSGVSYTSNLAQITDGAVAFDGSGDYLSIADSADFDFGSGAFTVEGFVYFTGSASQQMLVGQWAGGGSQLGWVVMTSNNSSRFIRFLLSTTGSDVPVDLVSSTAFDLNKWNHFALTRSGNTFYLFIDGILATSTTSASTIWNSTDLLTVGATSAGTQPFTGFLSNLHVVKGTALYTSNFTPPTAPISSVANTKLLCCKSNSSATAADVTPGTITANGNAAATNFNPFTVNINTQRGKQSGWCTLNPLAVVGGATYSNGNLKVTGSAEFRSTPSTITISVGKWYVEYFFDTWVNDSHVGVMNNISPSITGTWAGSTPNGFAWAGDSGDLWTNNGLYNSSFDVSFTTGDTCQIAFDADNGNMYFGKNGIWLKGANPSAGTGANWTGLTNGPYYPYVTTTNGTICSANFGQKPFKFPPPAGFQPLALANTPRPTIVRPDQFVGVSTWSGAQSGSGGLTRQISLGMQPDFVWIKQRNQAYSTGHQLYDSVRGAGAEKELNSSGTAAEGAGNIETYGWLNSFDKTGFTVKGGSSDYDYVDKSGVNYVAWAWKAGGNSNTYNINDVGYATASAAGLTAGTITPTGASVNTKSGFSIITYTGGGVDGSVGHGLGVAPKIYIAKNRSAVSNWAVAYTIVDGSLDFMYLNLTNAAGNATQSLPTSTLINLQQSAGETTNGENYVIYAWSEIPGFSKFGSYTGNGSADGPMLVTGFRPKWILIKKSSATGNVRGWVLVDSERSKYNVSNLTLFPHASSAEDAGTYISVDFLSNGFKLRSTEEAANQAYTYIYMAFAETPTQNLYGAQANAR